MVKGAQMMKELSAQSNYSTFVEMMVATTEYCFYAGSENVDDHEGMGMFAAVVVEHWESGGWRKGWRRRVGWWC